MYTVYFVFFQVASATATRFGLSRGLLGLQYDQINESESESESESDIIVCLNARETFQRRPTFGGCALTYNHTFIWTYADTYAYVQRALLVQYFNMCVGLVFF